MLPRLAGAATHSLNWLKHRLTKRQRDHCGLHWCMDVGLPLERRPEKAAKLYKLLNGVSKCTLASNVRRSKTTHLPWIACNSLLACTSSAEARCSVRSL
jgi:hypothetical protein